MLVFFITAGFSNWKKVAGGICKVAGALSHLRWRQPCGIQKVPGANAWGSRWLAPGAG